MYFRVNTKASSFSIALKSVALLSSPLQDMSQCHLWEQDGETTWILTLVEMAPHLCSAVWTENARAKMGTVVQVSVARMQILWWLVCNNYLWLLHSSAHESARRAFCFWNIISPPTPFLTSYTLLLWRHLCILSALCINHTACSLLHTPNQN